MPSTHSAEATEAGALLRRLLELSRSLGLDFDQRSVAEQIIAELDAVLPIENAAIYVGHPGMPMLRLASRGGAVPAWPAPGDDLDALLPAPDEHGVRLGQYTDVGSPRMLATFPLIAAGPEAEALLVFDRDDATPITQVERQVLATYLQEKGPLIDASIQFTRLRMRGLPEEQMRMTRLLQNSLAQELGALGFQVDVMRLAPPQQPVDRAELDDVRGHISNMLADLRNRVVELGEDSSVDTTLGAMLCSRVQTVCATTGIRATITLHEDGQRLGAGPDSFVYQSVLNVLAAARYNQATDFALSYTLFHGEFIVEASHNGGCPDQQREIVTIDPPEGMRVLLDPTGRGLTIECTRRPKPLRSASMRMSA